MSVIRTYFRPVGPPQSTDDMMRTFFLSLALVLVASGCSGPKVLTKRGAELQQAGMGRQAAELYYNALRKKPGYVDAMVGLKATGQGVIDGLIGDFKQASMNGDRAEVVGHFEDMTAYRDRMARVGVDLLIPASIERDFRSHLDEHLVELDAEGRRQLEEGNFSGAEDTFKEMIRLNPEYGESQALLVIAQAEPFYRDGRRHLDAEHHRAAHTAFQAALRFDPDYKDARTLMEEALEEGRFNIALIDFDSSPRQRDVALELRSGMQNGLIRTDDPFIGIVDRTQREEIIAEQELSISGLSDEQVEVGGLAGARAMLSGAILRYNMETGSLVSTPRQGFRKYFKEVKDEEGNITKVAAFAPVQYVVHSRRRDVVLKFELKLVSTETSEVLLSKVEEVHAGDEVEYATSEVEANMLYPARANGEVNRSGNAQLKALLQARRELVPESALRDRLFKDAIGKGIRDVESFLADHIE